MQLNELEKTENQEEIVFADEQITSRPQAEQSPAEKPVKITVRRPYTPEEKDKLAKQIVSKIQDKQQVEMEKKSAADGYNSQIKDIEKCIEALANDYSFNEKSETVEVIKKRNREKAQWEYFSVASGELVETHPFSQADHQMDIEEMAEQTVEHPEGEGVDEESEFEKAERMELEGLSDEEE